MRLVDDLSGEDRLSVFGLHLHPFKGHSVRVAELASHYYAVDHPCILTPHLSILVALCHTLADDPTNTLGAGRSRTSENSVKKLSEKGYEQRSEHVFGPIRKPKWAEEPLFGDPEGYTVGASETFHTVSWRSSRGQLIYPIAQDNVLPAYLDQMVRLLNDEDRPLRRSEGGDELSILAKGHTLKVLPRLDGERKARVLSGTVNWARCKIPFYLKRGQKPDLIKLNVVVEGQGTMWLRDVKLLKTSLAS